MSDDKLIDFSAERGKRIHDVHEKRLQEMRQAFEQAMPLAVVKKRPRTSRRNAESSLF